MSDEEQQKAARGMTPFRRWLPGLAALMISLYGCFVMLLCMTNPDGEFGVLGALPILLMGLIFGLFQWRQWAGVAAIVLPIGMCLFLWLHGPLCHWNG